MGLCVCHQTTSTCHVMHSPSTNHTGFYVHSESVQDTDASRRFSPANGLQLSASKCHDQAAICALRSRNVARRRLPADRHMQRAAAHAPALLRAAMHPATRDILQQQALQHYRHKDG
jgi:hypothetical protein